MKYLGFTAAFLAASATAKAYVHIGIPGYKTVDLQWEVESTPGGPNITVNGTIEEVYEQMSNINPKFHEEYLSWNMTNTTALAKRYAEQGWLCGGRWQGTKRKALDQGIHYLRNVPGKPTRGPGPGSCGRVSCSWESAIWWCNDNAEQYTLDSFANIADGATVIFNNCPSQSGQTFYVEGWNVIVRKDDCKRMAADEWVECVKKGKCDPNFWQYDKTADYPVPKFSPA